MKITIRTAKPLAGLAALMAAGITSQAQYVFTELEYPGVPFGSTYANGIDGANIVGAYWDTNNVSHGFLYNATNWSTLDAPGASSASGQGTTPFGISGTNIVGTYTDSKGVNHGFLYNLTTQTWTRLDYPLAGTGTGQGTWAFATSGANIVGYDYDSGGNEHGFLYTGGNWITLNAPGAGKASGQGTEPLGISESTIAGTYIDSSGNENGFLYNMVTTNWTKLDDPAATTWTGVGGISGTNVSGAYWDGSDAYGFVYNGKTWTTLRDPLAPVGQYPSGGTFGHGISGDAIVGAYYNGSGLHGFVATPIPQLAITQSTNGPTISWPLNPFVGWTLQQNPDLNTTNWMSIGGVSTDGTNNFVTITPAPGNAFFRLNHK
jgi:hypothetical protein